METVALILLATVAGLLALAFWWIRRNHLAVYPPGRQPLELRPLPTGCELGEKLMQAQVAQMSATETATGGSSAGASGDSDTATPPKRKKKKRPSRREFLRNAWGLAWGGVLAGFGAASLAFLWPNLSGGFGAVIDIGSEDEVLGKIRGEGQGRTEFPQGRMLVIEYDASKDPEGQYEEITNGAQVMALYQRCVHLGCKVPWCPTSQWWECPCHGSRYNRWGEWQGGPAPRGLDRFTVTVQEGRVLVDTSTIITGPPRTASVLQQPPEGPSCL